MFRVIQRNHGTCRFACLPKLANGLGTAIRSSTQKTAEKTPEETQSSANHPVLQHLLKINLATVGEHISETLDSREYETLSREPGTSDVASEAGSFSEDVPWYLRQEFTSALVQKKELNIPSLPANSPTHLSDLIHLLAKDLGVDELLVFNIGALDDTHEFKLNNSDLDYIIIGTGKSEKHIYKAASEVRTHIKHTYGVVTSVQGMVSAAKTPAARRRLLKKARRGLSATENDYELSANSWILCKYKGVEIHILTDQRRAELNLELIWCAPENAHLYKQEGIVDYDSDNVLSSIRRRGFRRYHTSSRLYSSVIAYESLTELLEQLENLPLASTDEDIAQSRRKFNACFTGSSSGEFDTKTTFLKTIHLVRPELVSFEEVEESLLSKYASSAVQFMDSATEKAKDVTEYARLLLDSPQLDRSSKEALDYALSKLSSFISTLYEFSTDKFLMSADPLFLPLLWRLTYTDGTKVVTPRAVSDVIEGKSPFAPNNGEQAATLAYKNSRNVLSVASYHDKKIGSNLSAALREQVVFTYGNCGKWDQFWDELKFTTFVTLFSPPEKLDWIVRLAVYLALTGHKVQSFKFLSEMLNNPSFISGGFADAYAANGSKFNSETQKVAFVAAVTSMIDLLEKKSEGLFEDIRESLVKMDSNVHDST